MPPRAAPLSRPVLGGPAQGDVAAQAANQRILFGRCLELLEGSDPRIHTEQAFLLALRQVRKKLGDRLFAGGPEPGAAHQPHAHATHSDHGRQRGNNVGLHCPLGPMAVAFAQQGTCLFVGAQAGNGRGVDGMHRPVFPAQPHGFEGQAVHAPPEDTLEQCIQRHLATLQGTLDPVPAPAQMDNVGQRGAGQAALVVDELASKHGDEHDADKVCGARRQHAH